MNNISMNWQYAAPLEQKQILSISQLENDLMPNKRLLNESNVRS